MDPKKQNDTIERLEHENQRLRLAVEELSIINEIATAISSTMEVDKIVDLIVKKCVKYLKAEQAAVMLLDENEKGKPFHTMVRTADTTSNILPYRLDTQLTGWMLKHQKPLLINNFKDDDRFQTPKDDAFPVHSLISVPMQAKGRMIGLLTIFNKKSRDDFQPGEQRLLSIIAVQSAQIIENARLLAKEQALMRMQEELRLASDIQSGLLPASDPNIEGYDISGLSLPAQIVGGDYYDFIEVDDHRYAVCVGDISGKGLPAALLMANLQATVRAQTLLKPSPDACLRCSNTLLHRSTDSRQFATMFYAVLDISDHRIRYANAGHNQPILMPCNGTAGFLEEKGIALSLLPDFSYTESELMFSPGDLLFIYSDGATEAMNPSHEEFGEERLLSIASENKDRTCSVFLNTLLQAIQDHTLSRPQSDDITLVALKRKI